MVLHELTQVPGSQRDLKWENNFFQALSQENIGLLKSEPQYGPDGWPYLFATTIPIEPENKVAEVLSAKATATEATIESTTKAGTTEPTTNLNLQPTIESSQKILRWLSERGLGLVLNPDKSLPDFVFSFGMIWHFRETGFFYLPKDPNPKKEEINFANKEIKISGQPSTQYLPIYVRKIIKEFFLQQGVLAPKILMLSFDGVQFDLAFSLESLGNPPESEHNGICETIAWFLPTHYSILLTSEANLPAFELI